MKMENHRAQYSNMNYLIQIFFLYNTTGNSLSVKEIYGNSETVREGGGKGEDQYLTPVKVGDLSISPGFTSTRDHVWERLRKCTYLTDMNLKHYFKNECAINPLQQALTLCNLMGFNGGGWVKRAFPYPQARHSHASAANVMLTVELPTPKIFKATLLLILLSIQTAYTQSQAVRNKSQAL